jgi:two-component system chemotaxis sensor kinase CheA
MDDLLRVFLDETREALARLADDGPALAHGDAAARTRARCLLHTLKGSAGFLGLPGLEALAHAAEDLVDDGVGTAEATALEGVLARLGQAVGEVEHAAPELAWDCPEDAALAEICVALPAVLAALGPALGKELRLAATDDGTRIDRALARTLRTVLLHLVRNAADHGIEPPAARRAAGKAPAGTITVAAWREGAQLNIAVRDDGRGMDLGAFGAGDAAAQLRRAFQPGISTAPAVTTVSGRGIGLDIVRRTLEELGGTVCVSTAAGEGTIFDLAIPLGPSAAAASRAA